MITFKDRVRLGNETFERRIVASDIDTVEISSGGSVSVSSKGGEPWLRPSGIRINKQSTAAAARPR
ncbi:hypothetical protein [Shinella sp.]|uniref:hypothetical protein n=1 Tax=Shinella sp. TaxID=1870904 RepID=UPI0029AE80D2|nr:hypothetical protein [Shinella sp.]MDX3977524.1 hypothetical protein [Shinella sp.]